MNTSIERAPDGDVEKRTMRKIMMRIVPFLMISYFLAYLDRINIGFAALEMNQNIGIFQAQSMAGRPASSSSHMSPLRFLVT
jgi:sugar phosphate permease